MVAYNHADWVAEAIAGVVAQDYAGGFELIIGEDCSADATREIVLDWQRRHPHLVRVLVSDANVGPAANHARVIAAARGEYLAFCEGDDYWCHPGKLAAQAALLQDQPDAGLVHSDWVRARKDAGGQWRIAPRGSEHARIARRFLAGDLFPVFYFAKILRTCTLMMRRSILADYRADPLSRGIYRFEDTVIAAHATSRWRVAYWPEVSAVYRESPGSSLRSGVDAKIRFLQSALRFDSDARARFSDRPDYPDGYRWEVGIGLLAWSLRGRRFDVAREALVDLYRHFGPLRFLAAGWRALRLRTGFRAPPRRLPER